MRFSVFVSLLLAGCVSSEQNAAKCGGYGFKSGTDGFANCMMELEGQQSAKMSAFGSAMQSAGNNYSAAMRPNTVQANCTYNRMGTTTYQRCN